MESKCSTTPVGEEGALSQEVPTQLLPSLPTLPTLTSEESISMNRLNNMGQGTPYPRTPRGETTTSPATSTPGQLEGANLSIIGNTSPAHVRSSELIDSDESIINDSTYTNHSDTSYVPIQEETVLQECNPDGTWTNQENRANHTEDQNISVQMSLTNIMDDLRNEKEGFVMVTPQSIPMDWENHEAGQQIWSTLSNLEVSLDKEDEVKVERKNKDIETHRILSDVIIEKAKKVIIPLEVSEECSSLSNLTFTRDGPTNEAQLGMSNALKLLSSVDMLKLNKKNLVNIIKLLISICIDSHKKLDMNYGIIASLESSLKEMFYSNEKLMAMDKCRSNLMKENIEVKNKNEDLRNDLAEARERIAGLDEYLDKNRHAAIVSRINLEKEALVSSCQKKEGERDKPINDTRFFREKLSIADKEVDKLNRLLEIKNTEKMEIQTKLDTSVENYDEIDGLYNRLEARYDERDRSLKDLKIEYENLKDAMDEVEGKLDINQVIYQEERLSLSSKISELTERMGSMEVEVKSSRERLKDQEKLTKKNHLKYETTNKQNLEKIQKYEDEVYKLKQEMESKDIEINTLSINLNRRQETLQWSDQDGAGNKTPKSQRIPKKFSGTPTSGNDTQNSLAPKKTLETTTQGNDTISSPLPWTANSTRNYESSSLASDSDSSRGAIGKRKREETKKSKKVENDQSSKDEEIKRLEKLINSENRRNQKKITALEKENEDLKKKSEGKASVPTTSISTNTSPINSTSVSVNTVPPVCTSVSTNTTPCIETKALVNCGRCILATSNLGTPLQSVDADNSVTLGANPMIGVPPNSLSNPNNTRPVPVSLPVSIPLVGINPKIGVNPPPGFTPMVDNNAMIGIPSTMGSNSMIGVAGNLGNPGINTMIGVTPRSTTSGTTPHSMIGVSGNTPLSMIGDRGITPHSMIGVTSDNTPHSMIGATNPSISPNSMIGAKENTQHSMIGTTNCSTSPQSMIGTTQVPSITTSHPIIGAAAPAVNPQQVSSSSTMGSNIMDRLREIGDIVTNDRGEHVIAMNTVTWIHCIIEREENTPSLQKTEYYKELEHPYKHEYPDWLENNPWHPPPTKLNLVYSHTGRWDMRPLKKNDLSGPYYRDFMIVRVEDHITQEGVKKTAFAYGIDMKDIHVWFDMEPMKEALGTWVFPQISYYFNGRKWEDKFRAIHQPMVNKRRKEDKEAQREEEQNQRPEPRNSYKGQQRGKNQRRNRTDDEWGEEEEDNREPRSSGAGRASRPNRYEEDRRPGYSSRPSSRDRRQRSYSRDRSNRNRSNSRDRTRGGGPRRRQDDHYGGRS